MGFYGHIYEYTLDTGALCAQFACLLVPCLFICFSQFCIFYLLILFFLGCLSVSLALESLVGT